LPVVAVSPLAKTFALATSHRSSPAKFFTIAYDECIAISYVGA
jgi:hypothetical protein